MANENAIKDDNNVPVIIWQSSVDENETVMIRVNPTTWAILAEIAT